MKKRCVAMAYGNRPLDRVAVEETDRLIYIQNPQVADDADETASGAVGFPKEFVFEPDDQWLGELMAAFEAGDSARLDSLWSKGTPLSL